MTTEAREALDKILDELEPDAIRSLAYLAERLLIGQRAYGRLDLTTDKRDWRREIAAEVGDLLVYSAFEALKASLPLAPLPEVKTKPVARPEPTSAERRTVSARLGGLAWGCKCFERELRESQSGKGFECTTCGTSLVPA